MFQNFWCAPNPQNAEVLNKIGANMFVWKWGNIANIIFTNSTPSPFFYECIPYCFVKLLFAGLLIGELYKVTADLCQQELVLCSDLEVQVLLKICWNLKKSFFSAR